jgi:hypothetical protein
MQKKYKIKPTKKKKKLTHIQYTWLRDGDRIAGIGDHKEG